MRIETIIRRDHRMKAHRVVWVREVSGGLEAEVQRHGKRRLACGRCRRPTRGGYDRGGGRRWRDWKPVAATVRWAVGEGVRLRRRKPLHTLGIDEVSRQKGQSYFTLFYDLERAELLWASEGRKEEAVHLFFAWLGPRRARALRAVVMDMWAPYRRGVGQKGPPAVLVFDRFYLLGPL